ncbi:MAG: BlaI/MecI/CopY family transcriptional regulator [Saprospiraceae bacterium]|nr:BlaI/MecI/CopY family transcriptional regulator [Saprospiraceae bacterium]
MGEKKIKPTQRELAILEVLWRLGPSTVRQVHEALLQIEDAKKVGYTTTLKFMQLMHEKGFLNREMEGVSHVYTPTISEEDNVKQVLGKIVDTTFKGSTMKLVMQLLGNRKTSRRELNEIRSFLDNLEENSDDE